MIDLIREMVLAEIKIEPEIIRYICANAVAVPNYDLVYQLTYNQADPKVDELVYFMADHNLIEGQNIMEIMAGNGFESKFLKDTFPKNKYNCIDKATYFLPIDGLSYDKADCTDVAYQHPIQQDLIFIGGANASMCMLLTLKDLLNLSTFLQNNTKLGGYAVLSYFEESYNETNFVVDYSVKEIKNHENASWNGLYAHWFSVAKRDVEAQLQSYYDLVAVSADAELTKNSQYQKILFQDEPFIARNWQTAIVMEVMQNAGFIYVGNKWNPDARFMPFEKKQNLELSLQKLYT